MSISGVGSIFTFYPIGSHTRIGVDTVQTITITGNTQFHKSADLVVFQAEVGTIRYTIDGTTPTATLGFRLGPTDGERRIDLHANGQVKVIGETAGSFVNYQLGFIP